MTQGVLLVSSNARNLHIYAEITEHQCGHVTHIRRTVQEAQAFLQERAQDISVVAVDPETIVGDGTGTRGQGYRVFEAIPRDHVNIARIHWPEEITNLTARYIRENSIDHLMAYSPLSSVSEWKQAMRSIFFRLPQPLERGVLMKAGGSLIDAIQSFPQARENFVSGIEALLKKGYLPIINTGSARYGDEDKQLTKSIQADPSFHEYRLWQSANRNAENLANEILPEGLGKLVTYEDIILSEDPRALFADTGRAVVVQSPPRWTRAYEHDGQQTYVGIGDSDFDTIGWMKALKLDRALMVKRIAGHYLNTFDPLRGLPSGYEQLEGEERKAALRQWQEAQKNNGYIFTNTAKNMLKKVAEDGSKFTLEGAWDGDVGHVGSDALWHALNYDPGIAEGSSITYIPIFQKEFFVDGSHVIDHRSYKEGIDAVAKDMLAFAAGKELHPVVRR